METISSKTLIQIKCALAPRIMDKEQLRRLQFELHSKSASKTSCSILGRRLLLKSVGLSGALLCIYPAVAGPLPMMNEREIIWSQKMTSGVKVQDIVEGEGSEAHEGDLVEVNYVCRRSNGYFVHSTVDQFSGENKPVILPLDDKKTIQGLKEVLIGMKVGGKRRALIPPDVGYINENLQPIPDEFGPRRSLLSHANEPLVFEVQLLKESYLSAAIYCGRASGYGPKFGMLCNSRNCN